MSNARRIIPNGSIRGTVEAIASKSHLHRLLICAALSDEETLIHCKNTKAEDVKATIDCLTALGAQIAWGEHGIKVKPIDIKNLPVECELPCHESGSTLRFMLPVVCALGLKARFHMSGRLPQRPLAPLDEQLCNRGVRIWRPEPQILCCEGKLIPGEYSLPGNISSQYITGLLLALSLLSDKSVLTVTPPVESADYIMMTLGVCKLFGQVPQVSLHNYFVSGGGFKSPGSVQAEGDWSNAAFWLCAGAMPGGNISVKGLCKDSSQGDKDVCDILSRMGAEISWDEDIITVSEGERWGGVIDAAAIPDLIPTLSAVAAVGEGVTIIKNAARLRLKESDRIATTTQALNNLGAKVTEGQDSIMIKGVPALSGGTVDSAGDHRIAMMAAVASAACQDPVILTGFQAVNKSYPAFWDELDKLKVEV